MNFTIGELAELTDSTIQGDEECILEGVASLSDADTGYISFVSNPKYIKSLKVNFIGKASLFKPPFGFIFRWLGGAPIDRSKSNDKVKAIVDLFNAHDKFVLGMSPEGTRQKVEQWKTGFYYIAKGAKLPIVMATLDFQHKQIKISEPYFLTDDLNADFNHFHQYFDGVVGKHPELS